MIVAYYTPEERAALCRFVPVTEIVFPRARVRTYVVGRAALENWVLAWGGKP